MSGQEAGYWIKFNPIALSDDVVPDSPEVQSLMGICRELAPYGLFASYPEGAMHKGEPVVGSNGNVSYTRREGTCPEIVMTATQLPSKDTLQREDLTWVVGWDTENGDVHYHGPKAPTSEFWLHQQLYGNFRDVDWVVHGHAPVQDLYYPLPRRLWKELGIKETGRYAEDGTLAVPQSVIEVVDDPLKEYIILTGHATPWDQEHVGVVVMDNDPERAVARIKNIHEKLRAAFE